MTSVPDRSASCTCIRAVPCRFAPLLRDSAHRLRARGPGPRCGSAGPRPLADPDLFLGQLLVEEGVLPRPRPPAAPPASDSGTSGSRTASREPAPVELDDPGGQLRRKIRSWVTKTSVPPYRSRNSSSQRIDSMSRWLVGSSRSRMSGRRPAPWRAARGA